MNRRWLITFSLLAHTGLGIGLFAAGVWHIERLDSPKLQFVIGVPLAHGAIAEGGSSAAAPEKPREKEKKKRVVKDAQPQPRRPEAPEVAMISDKRGEGDGDGKGSATGDTDGPPGGERCDDPMGCTDGTSGTSGRSDPVCGNGATDGGETCDDGNLTAGDGCSATCKVEIKTQFVAPTVLQGLRVSGETQVHAPDTVKTMMLRDGRERSSGTLKLCIATDGGISSVSVAASTKYDAYDAKLVAAARAWRYKPYTVNGTPMPVCGMVTFVYTIR
ncbi:MAG: TonB family protein [Deltaproteobacteria bacterium]|nr:TonB family protein [Deltaproteobacteria bacterium]